LQYIYCILICLVITKFVENDDEDKLIEQRTHDIDEIKYKELFSSGGIFSIAATARSRIHTRKFQFLIIILRKKDIKNKQERREINGAKRIRKG
jgi:hypothetical protein